MCVYIYMGPGKQPDEAGTALMVSRMGEGKYVGQTYSRPLRSCLGPKAAHS